MLVTGYPFVNSTALMYAINYGDSNLVKMLINKGANVNLRDHNCTTPLMLASAKDVRDIAVLLTRSGAKK